jgi:cyclopropane fatty-acyl-phospholipid synthase-like methyltransferase
MIILVLVCNIFAFAVLLFVIYFLLRPISRGAIYFPTTTHGVEVMMEIAEVGPGQHIVDIGSGDGRILIACGKLGAFAEGYEVNPMLVFRSRRAIREANLQDRVKVYWKSFWGVNLSRFDTIIVYGIPYIMKDLEKKFARELKPGTKVLSNAFPFPDWEPTLKKAKILLYRWPVGGLPVDK